VLKTKREDTVFASDLETGDDEAAVKELMEIQNGREKPTLDSSC
jgi:hypothetical protein